MAFAANVNAASLIESFDVLPAVAVGVVTTAPTGWTANNRSTNAAAATSGWFQGSPAVFPAFAGPTTNAYIGANFNNTTGENTISNWLITPTLSYNNGDVVSFYSRTEVNPTSFADRLQLRFSNTGGTDVGALPTDVGTSTSLLVDINPTLSATGFPSVWTQYTATISGLSGPTNGAVAFRYFVTAGGPSGANSNYIGIDSFSITPVPEPAAWLMMALGLGALALRRKPKA